jgi:hypothetical protein
MYTSGCSQTVVDFLAYCRIQGRSWMLHHAIVPDTTRREAAQQRCKRRNERLRARRSPKTLRSTARYSSALSDAKPPINVIQTRRELRASCAKKGPNAPGARPSIRAHTSTPLSMRLAVSEQAQNFRSHLRDVIVPYDSRVGTRNSSSTIKKRMTDAHVTVVSRTIPTN